MFLSVAQNVFEGKVQRVIQHRLPGVDAADVLGVGASDLGAAMKKKYADQVDAILDSYNAGLQTVFLMGVVFACVSIVAIPLMEWRSVKRKEEVTPKPAQNAEGASDTEKAA